MQVKKVFGPPGTGKTTFLLNKVEEFLADGVLPQRVGYFAFTRKAATEAMERALVKFPHHTRKDFAYFRTLHSLAYLRMGVHKDQMATEKDYNQFSIEAGLELAIGYDEDTGTVRASHPALDVINLARVRCIAPIQQYNESDLRITSSHFMYIYDSYVEYMQKNNLLDFTDLLEMFSNAEEDYYPNLDVLMIDETQDLNPLQWKIVERLAASAKTTYLAGDDDQAIYTFSGADVAQLLAFPGENIILKQSYRVPRIVHQYSDKIIKRVRNRVEKDWLPSQHDGGITVHSGLNSINFSEKGSWMVLAAANYMLNDAAESLRSLGILFVRNNLRSIPESVVNAVYAWEALRKDKDVGYDDMLALWKYLDGSAIKHGFKKFKGAEDGVFTYSGAVEALGLDPSFSKDLPWYEALSKIPDQHESYMRAALRRGQSLRGAPKYVLSTIHGSKGGEADNVVVLTDLSKKFMNEYYTRPDNINRLLYVAVTRCRNALHVVYPKDHANAFYLP
jgi:DNA helicase-2/ATP-dependent DNA helicase PcrA